MQCNQNIVTAVVLPTGCLHGLGFWQGFASDRKSKSQLFPGAGGRGYKRLVHYKCRRSCVVLRKRNNIKQTFKAKNFNSIFLITFANNLSIHHCTVLVRVHGAPLVSVSVVKPLQIETIL